MVTTVPPATSTVDGVIDVMPKGPAPGKVTLPPTSGAGAPPASEPPEPEPPEPEPEPVPVPGVPVPVSGVPAPGVPVPGVPVPGVPGVPVPGVPVPGPPGVPEPSPVPPEPAPGVPEPSPVPPEPAPAEPEPEPEPLPVPGVPVPPVPGVPVPVPVPGVPVPGVPVPGVAVPGVPEPPGVGHGGADQQRRGVRPPEDRSVAVQLHGQHVAAVAELHGRRQRQVGERVRGAEGEHGLAGVVRGQRGAAERQLLVRDRPDLAALLHAEADGDGVVAA